MSTEIIKGKDQIKSIDETSDKNNKKIADALQDAEVDADGTENQESETTTKETAVEKEIYIKDLEYDPEVMARSSVNPSWVEKYVSDIENGAEFPPIETLDTGCDLYLIDGNLRVNAFLKLGKTTIQAIVHKGTRRDAILLSCKANTNHGKRRTGGEAKKKILALFMDREWHQWSATVIAEQCNVSRQYVNRIKKELTGTSFQFPTKTIGKDGKIRNTENIGKNPSPPASELPQNDKLLGTMARTNTEPDRDVVEEISTHPIQDLEQDGTNNRSTTNKEEENADSEEDAIGDETPVKENKKDDESLTESGATDPEPEINNTGNEIGDNDLTSTVESEIIKNESNAPVKETLNIDNGADTNAQGSLNIETYDSEKDLQVNDPIVLENEESDLNQDDADIEDPSLKEDEQNNSDVDNESTPTEDQIPDKNTGTGDLKPDLNEESSVELGAESITSTVKIKVDINILKQRIQDLEDTVIDKDKRIFSLEKQTDEYQSLIAELTIKIDELESENEELDMVNKELQQVLYQLEPETV